MLTLDKSEIHLWYADQSEFNGKELESLFLHWLDSGEYDRYQRYYFDRHRNRLLLSRMLIRSVLSRYSDVAPTSWRFHENPHGKPTIDPAQQNYPLYFNISHSGDRIVLATGRHEFLGVDIECNDKSRRILQIANRYFSKDELEALQVLPATQQLTRFYDLWTLKEAYIKARGLGLSIPLRRCSFDFLAHQRLSVGFDSELADDPASWQFWQIDTKGSFTLSLASKFEKQKITKLRAYRLYESEKWESVDVSVLRY